MRITHHPPPDISGARCLAHPRTRVVIVIVVVIPSQPGVIITPSSQHDRDGPPIAGQRADIA